MFGVAPSNQAAHILALETGMATDSVAKLLYEHTHPTRAPGPDWRLPVGCTVIVDEAGMLATGDLYQLVQLADRHQWRLALVGDPYQLPAVGRGGMFAELAHHTSVIELERVRRFTNEWEGPASLALRRGDPGVVGTYEHHGRIRPGSFDELVEHTVRVWVDETGRGRTVAITAATNDEVDRINHTIQTARVGAGDLDPEHAVTGGGGDRLHPGDVVATRRNDRMLTTDRGVIVKNRAQWTITTTTPDGTITLAGADGTITLPTDYTREHVRLAYAATVYGTQGATVDTALTVVSGATDHRNLYVGATRGRDLNELCVVADTVEDAREVLETALGRDQVDQPAVTVRRELLHQVGMVRTPQAGEALTTHATRTQEGAGIPTQPETGGDRPVEKPEPERTGPFEGLETVAQAYERLRAEQTARQAPRDEYQQLRNQLAGMQHERERLDKSWSPYEHGPLDREYIVRSNAQTDVSQLTTRLQWAHWRDRRSVRRQLDQATIRLDLAETVFQERYRQEADRLDPLIAGVRARLERAARPEPVGERDRQIDRQLAWLRWETTVGNRDRPSLGALHVRRDRLDRDVGGDIGRLTLTQQAIRQAITVEIDRRQVQYQRTVEAERAAAQRTVVVRQRGPELPSRGRGPELGL